MKEPKRGSKTESLSLRIDPKTKFVLEFLVRVTGIRITDLIERAIRAYADGITIGNSGTSKTWEDYWHTEEGVRMLNVISDKAVWRTFEEEELASFVDQHHEFFFLSRFDRTPRILSIRVLWPKIDEYLEHWRQNKAHDLWATGTLMKAALEKTQIQAPEWPRRAKTPTSSAKPVTPAKRDDLDDEIPF
jgi:hypothetical protein